MLKPDEKQEVAEIASDRGGNQGAKVASSIVTKRAERRELFVNTANKVLYLLLPVLTAIIVILVLQNNYTAERAKLNNARFDNLQRSIDDANRKLDNLGER